ncbi:hypothetical protein J3F83DRAFT_694401 [Trichoderma novae-zelandiae]
MDEIPIQCMHDARMEKGAPLAVATVQPAAMPTQNLPEAPSAPARPGHLVQRSLTEAMGDGVRRGRADDDETPTATALQTQLQGQTLDRIQTHRMRRSVDVPRSGAVTPIISPIHSRRTSLLIPKDGDDKPDFSRIAKEDKDREKEKAKEKLHGDKAKDKASSSTDELRQSLAELSNFSAETTRQLDQTHYALLEKTSSLQVMVKALKDLAQASCDLQMGFDMAAQELETDITNQLRNIGHFESQQSTIETLQTRIHAGRQTADKLAARVEAVRKQIEGWERADRAWQEKTRKRLRITWAALLTIVCIIGLLFMSLSYNSRGAAQGDSVGAPSAWRNTTPESKGAEQDHAANGNGDALETSRAWEVPPADDEPLRIFDEL